MLERILLDRRLIVHAFEHKDLLNRPDALASIRSALRTSVQNVREYIEAIAPDFIIFSGGSREVSRVICEVSGITTSERKIIAFPPDLNRSLYLDFLPLADIPTGVKYLKEHYPELTPDSCIVVLDDYVRTGEKAEESLKRLRKLGFSRLGFAVFVGGTEKKYAPDELFVGSEDPNLYMFIRSCADIVTDESKHNYQREPGYTSISDVTQFLRSLIYED